MASSSYLRKSYHVFLSFRGPDVRNTFLSHLYMALDQLRIYTYVDSEELRKGEQITPELMKAIEDSRIAVIIFSKNYASSSWCLDELTKIMECKKQKDLIVLPVFYKLEPREVRTPRRVYKEAMAKHEKKFDKESEKVKRWNEALLEAGSLSGWEFSDGDEAELIQNIVLQISTQLDRMPLYVAKYPVGIDSQVEKLKKMLNLQSKHKVLMIGLWGQRGVGRTTLAKAIHNAVFREFQGSSFLERVRENSKDLVPLQEKLLSEVLLGKKLTVFSVAGGSQLIQERLCNKRVLIILDDVDDDCQLNALAGDSVLKHVLHKFHRHTSFQVILPGVEMPKWLLPNKEGYISFLTSKDLYKKILGVAIGVIFQGEGMRVGFDLIATANCKVVERPRVFGSSGLDHLWFEYIESKDVWKVDDFGPNDLSHFHFGIRVSKTWNRRTIVKKCGFRLICKPIENDLEVLLQDDLLLDPALLYEVAHEDNNGHGGRKFT